MRAAAWPLHHALQPASHLLMHTCPGMDTCTHQNACMHTILSPALDPPFTHPQPHNTHPRYAVKNKADILAGLERRGGRGGAAVAVASDGGGDSDYDPALEEAEEEEVVVVSVTQGRGQQQQGSKAAAGSSKGGKKGGGKRSKGDDSDEDYSALDDCRECLMLALWVPGCTGCRLKKAALLHIAPLGTRAAVGTACKRLHHLTPTPTPVHPHVPSAVPSDFEDAVNDPEEPRPSPQLTRIRGWLQSLIGAMQLPPNPLDQVGGEEGGLG